MLEGEGELSFNEEEVEVNVEDFIQNLNELKRKDKIRVLDALLERLKVSDTENYWQFALRDPPFGDDDGVKERVLLVKGFDEKSHKTYNLTFRIKQDFVARTFDPQRRKWLILAKGDDGKFALLDKEDILDLFREATMDSQFFNDARRFLITNQMKELAAIDYYGFDYETKQWRLPPDYIATNAVGLGDDFYREFKLVTMEDAWQKTRAYKALFLETVKGIGLYAWIVLGAAFASLFRDYFLQKMSFAPFLILYGKPGTAKTVPAQYLLNLPGVNILFDSVDMESSAVFSQVTGWPGCTRS